MKSCRICWLDRSARSGATTSRRQLDASALRRHLRGASDCRHACRRAAAPRWLPARDRLRDGFQRETGLAPLLNSEQRFEMDRVVPGTTPLSVGTGHQATVDVVTDRSLWNAGFFAELSNGQAHGVRIYTTMTGVNTVSKIPPKCGAPPRWRHRRFGKNLGHFAACTVEREAASATKHRRLEPAVRQASSFLSAVVFGGPSSFSRPRL